MIANGFLRSDLFVLIGVTSDGSSFAVEPSSENRVTVVGVGEMSQKADMGRDHLSPPGELSAFGCERRSGDIAEAKKSRTPCRVCRPEIES
jgi:hypothetical protein